MQDCCIGTFMARWFAAINLPLPIPDISPHVIPLQPPSHCPSPNPSQRTPVCDAPLSVSMCSHCSTPTYDSEHVVFRFLFSVSLLRKMISIFIHVPAKDINSSFFNALSPQLPTPRCPSPIPPQQTPVCDAPLPVSMCSHCSTPTYE